MLYIYTEYEFCPADYNYRGEPTPESVLMREEGARFATQGGDGLKRQRGRPRRRRKLGIEMSDECGGSASTNTGGSNIYEM